MKNLTGRALVWSGAAISIAEIETGIAMAPMAAGQWPRALLAILLGHAVGGAFLFATGYIGAQRHSNAMETAAIPFGRYGAKFLALANLLQLLGWTAVMIAQGASAAAVLFPACSHSFYCVAIGALIALWLFAGGKVTSWLSHAAIWALLALTAALTVRLCMTPGDSTPLASADAGGFWPLFELSVAMPLSWLPLISDYTQDAHRPLAAPAVSALSYTLVSTWMYVLGFMVGCSGKDATFAQSIITAGMGAAGLFVVIFSTVTTTFLDVYSSGESARCIVRACRPRLTGLAVCLVGVLMAIGGFMDSYTDFLYLIASIFAPMAAVLLTDWFLFSRLAAQPSHARWHLASDMAAWSLGFATYQLMPAAGTLAAMAVSAIATAVVCIAARRLYGNAPADLKAAVHP